MFDLYIANKNYSSWSLRPWVLLKELEIPFVEKLVAFASDEWVEYLKRFSTVPCLVDGEVAVWDSLAICEYIGERHPGVWPSDNAARAWARSAAAEMHSSFSALRNGCPMNCGVTVKLDAIDPLLARDIARVDQLWCEGLTRFGGPYLAGPTFTAVDAFFAPVAFRIRTFGVELSEPAMSYAGRLLVLDSMKAWQAAGLAEDFREPGHEREIEAVGTIVLDRRVPAARVLRG